jgi:hypothetical protein
MHLDNDYGLYEERLVVVADAVVAHEEWCSTVSPPWVSSPVYMVADAIRAWVEDLMGQVFYPEEGVVAPEVLRMMASDVGSLWRVEWRRLAEHYVAEHEEGMVTA